MQLKGLIKSVQTVTVLGTCLTSITLSGCSSYAELIPFEQEKIDAQAVYPLSRCRWPELNETLLDGRTVIYMEASQLSLQVACQEIEQTNYDLATQNAVIANEAVAAFNELVDKADMHHQNAENELQRTDDERHRKSIEVMMYQGLIALVVIAAVL